jgi:SPP1 gp7 family putative phage head morphogenesis protein
LFSAVQKAYLRNPDNFTEADTQLISFMQENLFVFSGFKTEKYIREASAMLLNDKGEVIPFADFKTKVLQLDATYNVRYLSAEYDFAVASSQMASKWVSFQELQPDFPNLIYITAGDSRVRPPHEALNGTVQPINSSFWNTNFPPNGWGCRCDADATDQDTTKVPQAPQPKAGNNQIFNNNVGKNGIIFPTSHPYYEASKAQAKKVTDTAKSLIPKK